MRTLPKFLASMALAALPFAASAEEATIAVAANFAPTAEKLAAAFDKASGDKITIVSGATGKLYAQVQAGGPFDAFLSADTKTPAKMVEEKLAVKDSLFTYATGQLALWTMKDKADLSDPKAALTNATHVAIANPELAPYGKAGMETLEKLGLTDAVKDKIVTGENIAQTQTMVASGAAEMGFVAASALAGKNEGTSWIVPGDMHKPLTQDAVLLEHGKDNKAAKGFLDYLKGDEAKAEITAAGYAVK
jgi:molybdate transport system substrate-binding protein